MITTTQIDMYADEVVKKYVTEDVPLNNSIAKLAQDKNLNKNYIDRVVQLTNQKAYLEIFSKTASKEKYIQFPLANTEEVMNLIKEPIQKKHAEYFDDYKINRPSVSFFGDFEKQAENKTIRDEQASRLLTTIKKYAFDLHEKWARNYFNFKEEFEKFAYYLKQDYLLNRVTAEELYAIFPEKLIEKTASYREIKISKPEQVNKDVYINPEHRLVITFNNLSSLLKEAEEIKTESNKFLDLVKEIINSESVKEAKIYINHLNRASKDIEKIANTTFITNIGSLSGKLPNVFDLKINSDKLVL